MKTRQGFVSNSSSSSFVLAGILLDEQQYAPVDLAKQLFEDVPEDPDELSDFLADAEYGPDTQVVFSNRYNNVPPRKIFVGNRIFYGEYLNGSLELTLVEEKISEIRGLLNLSAEDYPTLLIAGTRRS